MKAVLRRRHRRSAQAGFTLIELMISLVMFSIAIAGVLSVAVSMVNGFREQRMAIGAETSARGGMEFVADAIRGASPAVPTGNVQHVGSHCSVAAANNAFVRTNIAGAPDELMVTFAYGSVATSSRTAYNTGTTLLTVSDAAELAIGDTILISNLDQGHLAKITGKSVNDLTLESQACGSLTLPTGGYPAGSLVVRAAQVRFYVANQDGIPTLFMEAEAGRASPVREPLAEGVEDMQISLAYDVNADGLIAEAGSSTDEWFGNNAGDGAPSGAIRAVRVSFVARATNPVPGPATYYRPAIEDHAASATADNFRRRVLSSIVEIRNLDGSK